MDKDRKSLDILTDNMIKIANIVCEKSEKDCTYTGIISSVNSDGYTIKYNGTEIKIKMKTTWVYKRNDFVKFCIPCGNKQKAYIVADLDLIVKYYDKKIDEMNLKIEALEKSIFEKIKISQNNN